MKREAAFKLIPELIGDCAHVIELSGNPERMYIEAAIKTLHTAANVFEAVEEHRITKRMRKTKEEIEQSYSEMKIERKNNFIEEAVRDLDFKYEKVKLKIQDREYRDKGVRVFISCLKDALHKTITAFQNLQTDPDYAEWTNVEEITRKTLRDYNRLLKMFIEEGNNV